MHFDEGKISRIEVFLDYIPQENLYHIYSFDTVRKGNKKLPNNEDIYESSLDIARTRFQ